MRPCIAFGCLTLVACHGGRAAPQHALPEAGVVAVVLERVAPAVADSVVSAAALATRVQAVSAPHLARLSAAQQRTELAQATPHVSAVLTLAPAFEPSQGQGWNDGSTAGRTAMTRSWRRFSARLVEVSSGQVLWSSTFSNGPPVAGFLPTPDIGRAPRLVLAELRSAGLLR